MGKHTHRGSIADNGSISMQMKISVVVFACPGYDDYLCAHFLQNRYAGNGSTAAAKNQAFLAPGIQTAAQHHGRKAKIVRIMAQKAAVGLADNGIHAAHILCGFRQTAIGHHGFFIGDGYIDGLEISVAQKCFHLFRFPFEQLVTVVTQVGMDLGE